MIFRPVNYEPYEDAIYVQLEEGLESGGFFVPVKAAIAKMALSVPTGVDMGMCPTEQITCRTFEMQNVGEVPAKFRWEVPPPFEVEPSEASCSRF